MRSATEIVLRPTEVPGHGIRLAEAALGIAGEVVRNPIGFTSWGLGLASNGVELALQAACHVPPLRTAQDP
jgi:hypothetical protein